MYRGQGVNERSLRQDRHSIGTASRWLDPTLENPGTIRSLLGPTLPLTIQKAPTTERGFAKPLIDKLASLRISIA